MPAPIAETGGEVVERHKVDEHEMLLSTKSEEVRDFCNGLLYDNKIVSRDWGCLLCRGYDGISESKRNPFVCQICQ